VSILPRPKPDPEEPPPAVAYWRDRLRDSRLWAWTRKHRSLAAAATAVLVVAKAWKRLLGFDWLDRKVEPEEVEDTTLAVGPAWAERPPDRTLQVPPPHGLSSRLAVR
jgi:hypothetical protein